MRLFLHLILLTFLVFALPLASSAPAAMDVADVESVWSDISPQAGEPDEVAREMRVPAGALYVHSEPLRAKIDPPYLVTVSFWRPPRA